MVGIVAVILFFLRPCSVDLLPVHRRDQPQVPPVVSRNGRSKNEMQRICGTGTAPQQHRPPLFS